MKQWFLLTLILFIPILILSALLYSCGRFLVTAFGNWRELRQLDAIKAESEAIRERRRLENEKRLDNGCDHAFDTGIGFPPDVCPKCGLAREKPSGPCDHVWRRTDSPAPASRCEKCGKEYRGVV
jgi:hypothetical protein